MKDDEIVDADPADEDDLLPEYQLDYRKARANPYASAFREGVEVRITVTLDPDVAKYFPTSESVNDSLRTLIRSIPTESHS